MSKPNSKIKFMLKGNPLRTMDLTFRLSIWHMISSTKLMVEGMMQGIKSIKLVNQLHWRT
jgi:hypothetical protein